MALSSTASGKGGGLALPELLQARAGELFWLGYSSENLRDRLFSVYYLFQIRQQNSRWTLKLKCQSRCKDYRSPQSQLWLQIQRRVFPCWLKIELSFPWQLWLPGDPHRRWRCPWTGEVQFIQTLSGLFCKVGGEGFGRPSPSLGAGTFPLQCRHTDCLTQERDS